MFVGARGEPFLSKMIITRPDWETFLKHRSPQFLRGQNDCVTFAADWAELLSGQRPGPKIARCQRSSLQAARILKEEGGVVKMFDRHLLRAGWGRVNKPATGDVVAIKEARAFQGTTVGVCRGSKLVTIAEEGGLLLLSLGEVEMKGAWSWVS